MECLCWEMNDLALLDTPSESYAPKMSGETSKTPVFEGIPPSFARVLSAEAR